MRRILGAFLLFILGVALLAAIGRLMPRKDAGSQDSSPGAAPTSAQAVLTPAQIAADKADMESAAEAVKQIVNRPAPSVPRTQGLNVTWYGDMWFHPGALTPDYNTVDIRKSQDLTNYSRYAYVSSDMTASVAYPGSSLEFNPMTKIFYTDRSVPKRRLTEAEMVEVNRLYRIIGRCRDELARSGVK